MSDPHLEHDSDHDEPRVPGGAGRLALVAVVALLAGAALAWLVLANPLGIGAFARVADHAGTAAAPAARPAASPGTLWTCGMHPNVLQDQPGTCPICQMALTPLVTDGPATPDATASHAAHAHAAASAPSAAPAPVQAWTCPMHPSIVRDEPGQCPICGMTLVPVRADEGPTGIAAPAAPPATAAPAGPAHERGRPLYWRHPHDPSIVSATPRKDEMGMDFVPVYSEAPPEEGPTVTVSSGMLQEMNVVLGASRRGDLVRTVRTVGDLDFDQAKMVSVTTKYSGFVEKVSANYLGQAVHRGDPLFEVYSPELVQTQQELLAARRYADRLRDAPPETRARAEALVDAARRRLAYWDVSEAQIARIEQGTAPRRTITVSSPASGLIMQRVDGLAGQAITPGMDVLHVADLSTLWLDVQLYEDQLALVEPGSEAEVTFGAYPGEAFHGRVRFVEPQVDERTRTATVTLELPNPDRRLRVGMFATVRFAPVLLRDAVLVPKEAVLRTGERDLVVLSLGEGRFAPRAVVLGPEGDEDVAILSGLEAGEPIVLSAQFLLASESKVREAVLKMVAERQAR